MDDNHPDHARVQERNRRAEADLADRVDARMRELGLATEDEHRPGEYR